MAKQDRKFLGVLYPDSETYDFREVLEKLDDTFTEWAYILHDCDTDVNGECKKPHVHWVGKVKNPCLLSTIANKLGVPENSVEYCKKWKSAVRYLIHMDDVDKFQYIPENVTCSFDYMAACGIMTPEQAAIKILDKIESEQCTSVRSMIRWCCANGVYSEWRRGAGMWSIVMNEVKGDL